MISFGEELSHDCAKPIFANPRPLLCSTIMLSLPTSIYVTQTGAEVYDEHLLSTPFAEVPEGGTPYDLYS
jgi:hypothetical protein